MKKLLLFIVFTQSVTLIQAQNYLTRNGKVSFYSHTALEDIKADNNEVVSVINTAAGTLEFKLAVKSFHFKKAAMEDHFNESDYMDSDKYPKASFKGAIANAAAIDLSKDGSYPVTVDGNLTIKDVTKPIQVKGTLTVNNGKITAVAQFIVKRKEYHVYGEAFTQSKINEEIQVSVNCEYEKM